MKLALWVAVRNRPHLAVTDEELVETFRTLQPNVHVPSNDTIGRDIKLILELSIPAVKDFLRNHVGVLHAMLDGWTSPNVLSMVGLIIQLVDDENELKSFLLDMIPLNVAHTGFNLAKALAATFKEYDIEKRVLSIVGDNASNNGTMMENLVEILPSSAQLNLATRIGCTAHMLNLVVKACFRLYSAAHPSDDVPQSVLSPFTAPKGSKSHPDEDEDEFDAEDDAELLQAQEDVDEAVEQSDAAQVAEIESEMDELLNARDLDIFVDDDERKLAQDAFRKMCPQITCVLDADLVEIAVSLKFDNAEKKRMIRAVLTRWNTITDVITRGLELQPALDRLCLTSTGRASIRSLLLSNEEWQVMSQLRDVLQPFKVATERLSTNKYPDAGCNPCHS
uniref:HAT C-terminal dimerisation domain-containing protein n=1 Tax=Mycena chlorophos TaxID=658473 RepID=A0ABQ0MBK4_MYCCL|nr:predicted protein [Mycena chlorophos]